MKNKRFLVTLIAIFACLTAILGFTACGSKGDIGNKGETPVPPIIDSGPHGGETLGGDTAKKNFTPSIEISLDFGDIYYYDEGSGYVLLGDETVYYYVDAESKDYSQNKNGLPNFKLTITVKVTVKNAADKSDKGKPLQTTVVSESFASFEFIEAKIKNGKLVFSCDLDNRFQSTLGISFQQQILDVLDEKMSYCGLTAEEKSEYEREFSVNLFGSPYVTAKNLEYSTDKFVYLTAPIDGGTVKLDLSVLNKNFNFGEKGDFSNFTLTFDNLKNYDLPEGFKKALEKQKNVFFVGSDLLNRSVLDKPDERLEGREDEFLNKNDWIDEAYCDTYMDRESIKFKKTLGYQYFTIEFLTTNYFGKKYSEKTLYVSYEKPSARYTFAKPDSTKKVKITSFDGATVTATYDAKKCGYTIQPKDLPVFFASKITTNEHFRYLTTERGSDVIVCDYEAPNSVSIEFPELDVREYLQGGLENAEFKCVYEDGEIFKATLKKLVELSEDEDIPYAEEALFAVECISNSNKDRLLERDDYLFLSPLLNGKEASFDNAFSIDCHTYLSVNGTYKQFDFTAKIKIKPYLEEVVITNSDLLSSEYWELDDLQILSGATVSLKWQKEISATAENKVEEVPLTASLLGGFSTAVAGTYDYAVTYGGKVFKQNFGYTVKPNPVTAIKIKEGSFSDTYVTHEDFTVTDSKLLVTYASGKTKEVDIDASMVDGFNKEDAGVQTLTVSYGGKEVAYDITVKEVVSLSLYDGLSRKYCINQKPQDFTVKVTFSDGDYDYIIVNGEKVQDEFDTSTKGGKRFNFVFGGKQLVHEYVVYEAAYLYYTEDGSRVIINKMDFETPTEGVKAYRLPDCVNIVIPETIDGLAVVAVSQEAFLGESGIESVRIPDTVKTIGDRAFSDCISLKTINIPYDASVGTAILKNCKKLEDLTIAGDGDTAQVLAEYFGAEFKNTSEKRSVPENLTVKFAEGTTTLIDEIFKQLNNEVQKVVFPSTQTSLGVQKAITSVKAFESLSSTVKVVDGVLYTETGANLYYYPTTLTNKTLVLGGEVTSIGMINNNAYLEEVTINGNLTSLNENAFYKCTALTKVTFNGSLSVIPDGAFDDCEKLANFKFPSNVTKIGNAFESVAIETVRLPETLTSIDTQAFYWAKVKRLYIPKSATQSLKGNKGSSYLYLEELVYDGSIPLTQLTVYRDGDRTYPQKLAKIYLTETLCDGFARGTNYNKEVYLSSKISKIPSDVNALYTKLTIYYEGSITQNSSDRSYVTSSLSKNYVHWW